LIATALAMWIFSVLVPTSAPIPGSAAPVPGAGGTVTPTLTSDALPSPQVTCGEQPAVDVLPEQLVLQTYITTWYPVGTMSAPSSTAAGPTQARRCFARTPEGALYAAVTRMAEEASATGVAQDAAAAGVTDIRFDGYQWLSFTPDRAVLLVRVAANNSAETRHAARALDVTWTDNDWAVVPDDSAAAVKAAASPERVFTPWGEN